MAQSKRHSAKYVYDIPYFERMELCRVLDQNDKWEELGGIYMNFDVLTIQTLRREIFRGNSPTDELLTKWGHQNHTILELFVLLSKMQHYQAMLIIKEFVDAEYHRLIYEGEQNLNKLFKPSQTSKCNTANVLNQNTSNLPEENQNIDIGPVENKILNGQEDKIANDIRNSNKSNAQTALMSKAPLELLNDPKQNNQAPGKFLKPDSTKDKNVSEISSIAETVGILPLITFKELEIATNGWDHSTILGKGGFGTVYKGTWKNTSVAIKRTRNSEADENHSIQIQQILGELKMLNSYRHDNILPLYGFSMDGEDPCLIYQFLPNGSLEDRLLCRHGTKPLSWYQRLNIATGTARGIQFLHTIGEKPLIHGDIKSANILLDLNFEPKIGDFGLAREGPYNHYTHMKVSRVHGTRPYLPDEFLRHKKFSTKVDTHSFGIVLFELGTGLRAYDEQRHHKFLKDLIENTALPQLGALIDKKAGPDDQYTFTNLIALGKCCVSRKPKDRPEMVVVLQELNSVALKRDMLVKVQSGIRQNNLTPSTPFEIQAYHDHLSQQRRVSPTASNASNFRPMTKPVSPVQPSFYREFQGPGNAASPEPQPAIAIANVNMNNFNNNNPFLPLDALKSGDRNNAEVRHSSPGTSRDHNGGSVCAEKVAVSKKVNLQAEAFKAPEPEKPAEKVCKAPVINISPPTSNESSSSSSSDDDAVPTPSPPEPEIEDLDYEFQSDIENFLPLISVLGVKGKAEAAKPTEETEEKKTEDPETGTVKVQSGGNHDIDTSAKGKPLWILHDSV